MPRPVARLIEGDFTLAIGFARYQWARASASDQTAEIVGVVSFITKHIFGSDQVCEELRRRRNIMNIAGCEQKSEGTTDHIGEKVDLGCVSAARQTNFLCLSPPFPPNAER